MLKNFGLRNVTIYYLLGVFLNSYFIIGTWYFYLIERGLTIQEIGIVEGVAFLVGILIEIPSGALADIFGRKNIIMLGSFFLGLASVLFVLSDSLSFFVLANSIMFTGFAFNSGSISAFIYDSLKEKKLTSKYDYVISRYSSISILSMAVSAFVGSILYFLNINFPWLAFALFTFLGVGILFFAQEPNVIKSENKKINYIKHFFLSLKELSNLKLRKYIFPIILISIMLELIQSIYRQALGDYFGFTGSNLGVMFGVVGTSAAIFGLFLVRIRKKFRDEYIFLIAFIIYCCTFLLASLATGIIIGFMVFLLIGALRSIIYPLVIIKINENIGSAQRATVISTISFLGKIPYIIFVLFFVHYTLKENIQKLSFSYFIVFAISFIFYFFYINIKKKRISTI